MSQPFRTAHGGRIDRRKEIHFQFDGRSLTGFAGDSLASALLANGIVLMGRSFKYHRPRGLLGAGAEEPNALVTIGRGQGRITPNLRATQVMLYEGLVARSQNRWPSLAFDLGEINNLLSPLFSAGFYYKTFMGPKGAWKALYEPIIRRAAGLGQPPAEPDPDSYSNVYAHCDVLVVGAGPAGLMAALSAAKSGQRVIVCDEQNELGGSLLHEVRAELDGKPASAWVRDIVASLRAQPNVTVLARTQAFGYFAQNFVALCQSLTDHKPPSDAKGPRERLWQVRAKHVVLATGAIERPLVFPGNDRPGIMLADAALSLLIRHGVTPGTRCIVFTAHDSAYRAALSLKIAGVDIAMIADVRPLADGPLPEEARKVGARVETGASVKGTSGHLRIRSVTLALPGGREETIACDSLLVCGGWTPNVSLFSQSRGTLAYDAGRMAYLPATAVQALTCAGACNGALNLEEALAQGAKSGNPDAPASVPDVTGDQVQSGGHIGMASAEKGGMAFVDFQNDVKASDILLAVREGFHSIEHIKRYTTTGMATDQGKTSNMNALSIAAGVMGKTVPDVGLTTFRQPYTPVTFGTLAGKARGDLFDPVRKTPMHDWALDRGAVFEDVGQWKRAWYFPQPGEAMHSAVERECKGTRDRAGLFDASTLGKIEIAGPDAAKFLNLLYANSFDKLLPGRCRYGLMLNEAGFIMDDGVIARLAPDRFHVTTTTGGAARVFQHMEDYRQTEFTNLEVWLTSITEQWAVIAVQGPQARAILEPLLEGVDMSREAMPHMSLREGMICGAPMRLFRVSFTGELGFEVNVPASHARMVWEAIWAQGRKVDAIAYGTEAMHILRAEKGYIIVGQDTDGTVTPDDVGLGWAIAHAKPDFVGKRGLMRPDLVAPNRKQLVGLQTLDAAAKLDEGAQIIATPDVLIGSHAQGHVTSVYHSATCKRTIALAMLENGRARMGESVYIPMLDGIVTAKVTQPIFYDPKGERLNG